MRTFSRLKEWCSYPEALDRPSYARDRAAKAGTALHFEVQRWIDIVSSGAEFLVDERSEWLERMMSVWTPPRGCETEVAMGLADDDGPCYVPVTETEAHVYVPDDGVTSLLTAGRADLIMPGIRGAVDVVDLKTGQSYLGKPKEIPQLLAQGLAATLRAGAGGFVPQIYYARLGLFDKGDGEAIWQDTKEWDSAFEVVKEAARRLVEPNVGPHCLGCWSRKQCDKNPEVWK